MKRPTSFTRLLIQSLDVFGGGLGVLVGALLAIVLWAVTPDAQVRLPAVVVAALLLMGALAVAVRSAWLAFENWGGDLPAALLSLDTPPIYEDLDGAILAEASDLFAQDSIASVYHLDDDGVERLLGLGVVMVVQENGLIQFGLTCMNEATRALFDEVKANPRRLKRQILIKPSVPQAYMSLFDMRSTSNE